MRLIMFYLSTMNKNLAERIDKSSKPIEKSIGNEKAERNVQDESNGQCLDTVKYTIDRTIQDRIPTYEKAMDHLVVITRTFKKVDKAEEGNYLRLLANTLYNGVYGVKKYILKLTNYYQKLKDMDVNSDDYLGYQIVESLPPQFGNMRSQYNTKKDTWNVNELIAFVVQEAKSLKKGKSHIAMMAIA